MDWLTYSRGTIYPNWFTLALLGHHEYSAKLTGAPVVESIFFDHGPKLIFAWGEKRIRVLGRHTMKLCATSLGRKKHFHRFDKLIKKAIIAAEKIYEYNLRDCSNGELINLYIFLIREAGPAHGLLNVDIDAFDVHFEDFLRNKIKENLKKPINEEEFQKFFEAISIPAYKTYLNQEEEAVLKLALKKNITEKDYTGLYKRYWWTGLGWENLTPHSEKYFISRIKRISDKARAKKKLKEIRAQQREIKNNRSRLTKKYKLEKISIWLEFLDKYAYYHEARKEMQVKTNHALYLIMLEMSRRLKIDEEDLNWLWGNEVFEALQKGKFNRKEIIKGKQATLTLIDGNGLKVFRGKAAVKKFRSEIKENIENGNEVKGFGAMPGKVTGTAKVCNGLEDALRKIKRRDVLICGMTTPDYIAVMKKAAAIITDEGGLTCHAAIVSRELKIPCIVGTKIATKIFEDNDIVEVDATKGVAKIIKL
ncbi:MAG: putative phosphoenolpyruvate synthase [Candidatus Moranbacteria bacterium GW2011_GWC1_45_18]|nr:MAG: putative phosphoenolpyruvate synthase [Candidatus Moranbacteria bacterium GW2011_GWC2_40_12]KKT33474.1 MAG: putative phosphoenolpyruvate synthase [Candidatus Moranbacteria bacterium GW2011_GWF2_44_10]KKU00796.1 MAG: putative phosphoenolpyruvate synthase [Candidatus Moranbacteria bacterium GW2011_GWC1_45_18]OGI22582.1 MAG: hypothetical protein A2194_01820 [Candidatus Moranbacteria bacterium RIFOXYA1_FULL_44_8]